MKLKIPYYNTEAALQEPINIEINDKFKEVNTSLVSQALHVERNKTEFKSGLTKTRSEVRGGGKKPWKQKGTGRARAGSNRSPLWRGGGITFGPDGQKKNLQIPQKMKQMAILSMVVHKAIEKEVAVIEKIEVVNNKTKNAAKMIEKINNGKRVILVTDVGERGGITAWRNLPLVGLRNNGDLALNDLNSTEMIIFTKTAFGQIEERLKVK